MERERLFDRTKKPVSKFQLSSHFSAKAAAQSRFLADTSVLICQSLCNICFKRVRRLMPKSRTVKWHASGSQVERDQILPHSRRPCQDGLDVALIEAMDELLC